MRPTQPLAMECATKNPAVISTMPTTIHARLANALPSMVLSTPSTMMDAPVINTFPRPRRSANAPASGDANMPNT